MNENDKALQSGNKIVATVVSIGKGEKDKQKQDGRVQVRFTPQQDMGISEGQLVWVQVQQSPQDGGFRGIGDSIGHNLVPGSTVILDSIGQQNYIITGVMRNENQNPQEADSDFSGESQKTTQEDFDKKYAEYDGNLYNVNERDGSAANFGTLRINPQLGDAVDNLGKRIKQATRFGQKRGLKSFTDKFTPHSISSFARNQGNLQDATKAIQDLVGQKGELIAGALEMTNKLKEAVQSSGPISMTNMVGGQGNIANALSSISAIAEAAASGAQLDEDDLLCEIYEEITGLPCSIDGKHTAAFILWRKAYLAAYEAAGALNIG